MSDRWYRICVDVSATSGNVLGASWELHVDDETKSFGTVPVGPFDEPVGAFRMVEGSLPIQLRLV